LIGNAIIILAFTTSDFGAGVVVTGVGVVVTIISVVVGVGGVVAIMVGIVVAGMVVVLCGISGSPLTHILAFMRPSVDHPIGQDLQRPEKAPGPVSLTGSTGQIQTFSNATSVSSHFVHAVAFAGDM
jgi:predicted metal-dependent enzyme (double-stranded beta helix superfamily)